MMLRRNKYRYATDEHLLAALQKGRQQALAELYRRYNEPLRYYFFRMTGREAELARDYCQDLFVKVAEQAHRYHGGRPVKTWLYSMAHNMCKNHYRHEEVRRKVNDRLLEADTALPAAAVLSRIDEETFRKRIDATLLELDADRRGVFLLRHREGLSLREIADIQDCPLGTVKSRLHYTHRFLATQLADLKPEILHDNDTT